MYLGKWLLVTKNSQGLEITLGMTTNNHQTYNYLRPPTPLYIVQPPISLYIRPPPILLYITLQSQQKQENKYSYQNAI